MIIVMAKLNSCHTTTAKEAHIISEQISREGLQKAALSMLDLIFIDSFSDYKFDEERLHEELFQPKGDKELPKRVSSFQLPTIVERQEVYDDLKKKCNLSDCIKEIFHDEIYRSELKDVLEPISQHSQQTYKYRLDSIMKSSKEKLPLQNLGI